MSPTSNLAWRRVATPPVLLFFGALVYQALWALSVPWPVDWDPAYYQSVAANIASGKGAVTGSIWQLATLPKTLPFAAHQHWMPLPVWILVPFTWLWRAHGAQLTTVLLASLWAPLAWAHAKDLGASNKMAILAGGLAATALAHVRFTATPDSIALYGTLGGLGFLWARRGNFLGTSVVIVLAALTRNEGFWLGTCLILALKKHRWIGLLGVVAMFFWQVRNYLVFGDAWLEGRLTLASVVDVASLRTGQVQPLSFWRRILVSIELWPRGVIQLLALNLPLVGVVTAWWHRRDGSVRAAALYAVTVPLLLFAASPGIALSGSVFRTAAALAPLACALTVIGLKKLGDWTASVRGYHRAFVPTLLCIATVVIPIIGNGLLIWANFKGAPDCEMLAGVPEEEPVLSASPLQLEARCGHFGAQVPAKGDATYLAKRYHIKYALVGWWGIEENRIDDDLPGWELIRPGLVRAPYSGTKRAR